MKKRRRLPQIKYWQAKLAKLDVRPGDTLVLQTDLMLSQDQIQAIRERFDEQAKHLGVHTMILTAGFKLGVLRKAK